jgi:uncharacterized RDD family membrane protein YckC
MKIYIARNGQSLGPYSIAEVHGCLWTGELTPDALAWHEGITEWVPLHSIQGVRGSKPPQIPALPTAMPAPHQTTGHSGAVCPLCGSAKHMHKVKPLYGYLVCKMCHDDFATRRQFAFFLDCLGLLILVTPVGLGLGGAMAPPGASSLELGKDMTLVLASFFLLFRDCFAGHSPGKFLCGVKVIDKTTGKSCGFGSSFKRNLPLLIPLMPIVVGFELKKGTRTGDGWANTKVIWKKYANILIFSPQATPAIRP